MSQSGYTHRILLIIISLVVFLFIFFYYLSPAYLPEPIAKLKYQGLSNTCSPETLACDNGMRVGRVGPKCEFAPCPTEDPKTKIPLPTSTPTPAPQSMKYSDYAYRNYEPTGFMLGKIPYPSYLTSISTQQLIKTQCTLKYYYDEEFGYSFYENDKAIKLDTNDSFVTSIISLIKKNNSGYNPNAFFVCNSEDGRKFVEFEVWGGGGGGKNVVYIHSLVNNSLNQLVKIDNYGVPYFGCSKIIQLTKDNYLYLQCVGENSASIYALNLNTNKLDNLIKCSGSYNESTKEWEEKCYK